MFFGYENHMEQAILAFFFFVLSLPYMLLLKVLVTSTTSMFSHQNLCFCMLQKITKEKNALAERLKGVEASRKRVDDEFKRFVAEAQTREEIRKSLEGEVRRLTQTVGQTEGEKKEKEDQITRCEAYIDGMESKLQVCQVFHLANFLRCQNN